MSPSKFQILKSSTHIKLIHVHYDGNVLLGTIYIHVHCITMHIRYEFVKFGLGQAKSTPFFCQFSEWHCLLVSQLGGMEEGMERERERDREGGKDRGRERGRE